MAAGPASRAVGAGALSAGNCRHTTSRTSTRKAATSGAPSQRSRVARWLGAPLVAAFLVEVLLVVWRQFPAESAPAPTALDAGPAAIGHLLFRNYVLPFEVTSILVLVAVLGAVV